MITNLDCLENKLFNNKLTVLLKRMHTFATNIKSQITIN